MSTIVPPSITDNNNFLQDNLTVMPCEISDIHSILLLNRKYLWGDASSARRDDGFIKISYSFEQMLRIKDEGELIIAKASNEIVGYYLIGGASHSEALNYQKKIALEFAKQNDVDTGRIAYGLQICIEELFRNTGLFFLLTKALLNSAGIKYDYFFCSISDENARSLASHRKLGWEIIDHQGRTNYLVYNTNKALS